MFLAQLAASMAVWALAIAFLFRSRARLHGWAAGLSRPQRAFAAVRNLVLSILVLALGMAVLPNGGLTAHGLTLLGWVATTVAGALFVMLQTAGLFPLVLNAVTRDAPEPSDRKDPDRP